MMEARNFTYMFYGFAAAWVLVLLYVISLARRGARLRRELEDVRRLTHSEREPATRPAEATSVETRIV